MTYIIHTLSITVHILQCNSHKVSRGSAKIISEILIKSIKTRLCLVQQKLIQITSQRFGNYDKDATNSTGTIIDHRLVLQF